MNMSCPEGIGRDSWGREGRESVGWLALKIPRSMGEEALTEVVIPAMRKRTGPRPPV